MAERIVDGVAILSVFFLTSFPFFSAVPNLMYLSDRNKADPNDIAPATIGIYIHVVFMFTCGICLKLRFRTALLSFLIALETIGFTMYFMSFFSILKYHKWAKLRFYSHMIGVVASYVTLLAAARQSSRWQRFSGLLFTIYAVASAYVILHSQSYPVIARYIIKKAAEWLPLRTRPDWSYQALMWAAGFFVAPGVLMPFGWGCRFGSLCLLLTVAIFNGVYDCLFGAWMKKEKLDYWVTVRIAVDNLAVVFALFLITTKTYTLLKYSPAELQMMMAMTEEEQTVQEEDETTGTKLTKEEEQQKEIEDEVSLLLSNGKQKKLNHILLLESNLPNQKTLLLHNVCKEESEDEQKKYKIIEDEDN